MADISGSIEQPKNGTLARSAIEKSWWGPKKGLTDLNPNSCVYGEFRNLSLKSAGSARFASAADHRS